MDTVCAVSQEEVEARVTAEYEKHLGAILEVTEIDGYIESDSVTIQLATPARVVVTATREEDIARWNDREWCDPVWNVDLLEPHPEMNEIRSLWVYAQSHSTTGEAGEPPKWRRTMDFVTYVDKNDLIYGISQGIGGVNGRWFAGRRKPGKTSTSRVTSPKLPERQKAEQAQADLDAYAVLKGWKTIAYFKDSCGSHYFVTYDSGNWVTTKKTNGLISVYRERSLTPEPLIQNAVCHLTTYALRYNLTPVVQ